MKALQFTHLENGSKSLAKGPTEQTSCGLITSINFSKFTGSSWVYNNSSWNLKPMAYFNAQNNLLQFNFFFFLSLLCQ